MVDWNRSLNLRSPVVLIALVAAGATAAVLWFLYWPDQAQKDAISRLAGMGAMIERDDNGNALSVRINPGTSLKALEQLVFLPRLKTLGLPTTDATDADLVHLSHLTALEELTLSGNRELTDEGLKKLGDLINLKELYLTDIPIDGSVISSWSRLTSLEELNLSYTKLDEKNLVHLSEMKNLKLLDVTYTDFSDAGLEFVRGLKQLSVLFVMATRVTPEGAAELKKALPDVNVKFGL